MKNDEAIKFLNELKIGMFCTVNIPLYNNKTIPVTAMYEGKDKDGRYKFADTGRMVIPKELLENEVISIERDFNEKEAREISINKKLKSKFRKER